MPILAKLIALSLILGACAPDKGQVGEENFFCDTVATERLLVDEPSSLGFTAIDILQFSDGSHSGVLRWSDATEANLTIIVEHSGVTNHLTRAWNDDQENLTSGLSDSDCSDQMELELTVTMRTDDGSLDETWMLSLYAETAMEASLSQTLTSFNGSLDIRSFTPAGEFDDLQAYLEVSFSSATGISGTITGQGEHSSSDTVAVELFDIAFFAFP